MSQFSVTKSSVHEESVWMTSGDSLGMNLGELRAAVKAAEGLVDESQVVFSRFRDSVVEGERYAKTIIIRERSKAT